jgi:DNA-binding NtrC family response regulator
MARILVVDDEALILNVLKTVLSSDGHTSVGVQDGKAALKLLHTQPFDLMISDLRMSPMDGIEILRKVREDKLTIPVIMMTGYGTVKSAIEALSLNVFDYVSKPFKVEEFLATVRQALLYGQTETDEHAPLDNFSSTYKIGSLIAISQAMQDVCEMIKRVSPVDVPVLISGGPGVGRGSVARTIHDLSPRKANKFMSVSCGEQDEALLTALLFGSAGTTSAALHSESKGLLEEAEGGTLLLSDADLIPSAIQDRLIEIAQKTASGGKPLAGVRFIGAITDKPDQPSVSGAEAKDMFHRLGALEIKMALLRERKEDSNRSRGQEQDYRRASVNVAPS